MSTEPPPGPQDDAADAVAARKLTDAGMGADTDTDRIHRAAAELLRSGQAGLGMTETTARYRQLELAQLLHAIAHGVERGNRLPTEVLRHAANLARHILNYPAAVPSATGSAGMQTTTDVTSRAQPSPSSGDPEQGAPSAHHDPKE